MFPIRDTVRSRHVPVATWTLIALNLFFFFRELSLPAAQAEQLIYLFGIVPARFVDRHGRTGSAFRIRTCRSSPRCSSTAGGST